MSDQNDISYLFLARLLDTLLTGVQRALLALGSVHHVLLGLGIFTKGQYS